VSQRWHRHTPSDLITAKGRPTSPQRPRARHALACGVFGQVRTAPGALARALLFEITPSCRRLAALAGRLRFRDRLHVERVPSILSEEATANMTWSTPAFEDLRLGFEINLYINNR